MITGQEFNQIVQAYFHYLVTEFGFNLKFELIKEYVFYSVRYESGDKLISISYENLEDFFQTDIYLLENASIPDVNDFTKRLSLEKIRRNIFARVSSEEIAMNNQWFGNFIPSDAFQRKLLKAARDLRLCLLYFERL